MDLTLKTIFFFEGRSCFKFNNLRLTSFVILHQRGKKVKTKSQKVLAANFYVCSSYRGITEGGLFAPYPE